MQTRDGAADVELALDSALTDAQVIEDLRTILRQGAVDGVVRIELDEQWVPVPLETELVLVTKAFFKEYQRSPFGTYKAQVAIVGIADHRHGVLEAKYCFATLYYNAKGVCFTTDFHRQER